MIYYNDTYYEDIEDLLEQDCEFSTEYPDCLDYIRQYYKDGITVTECREIPLMETSSQRVFSAIWDSIDADNWPEDSDGTERDAEKAIKGFLELIPSEAWTFLKEKMPTVWMTTKEKTHYSLEELEGML